ncbi:hypothetical protein C5S35_08975 [Candidatus Methanophagaceae archaeon]|jgi:protein-S-isoprenylcysteine O-methyltransferase Ste14|nr:hypothetical protein C5S35_12420 [Methanophagales archaeon]KAF5436382.1 hypothetical protein C5S35_08975 [Methanophagales archaeon]
MKGYGEILVGLLLVVLGVAGIWYFRVDVLTIIKGVIGIIVLLVGAVFLMIGVSDVRDKGEEELTMDTEDIKGEGE